MNTLVELAQAAYDIYDPLTPGMEAFSVAGVVFGIKRLPDGSIVVAFRGTDDVRDMLRDGNARMIPIGVPALGVCVHEGLYAGMPEAVAVVASELAKQSGPVYLDGHSMGAARAWYAGWLLMTQYDHSIVSRIARVVTYACPRPGNAAFASIASAIGVVSPLTYVNGYDPVPNEPPHVPVIAPYEPVLTYINTATLHEPPPEAFDLIGWHHMGLYLQGVKRIAGLI